jgi:hypothetical protein
MENKRLTNNVKICFPLAGGEKFLIEVDGTKIRNVRDVTIHAGAMDLTRIIIEFFANVEGEVEVEATPEEHECR